MRKLTFFKKNTSNYLKTICLVSLVCFLSPSNSKAQLFELDIEEIINEGPIPVFRTFPDKTAIIIRSSLTNLRFDSTFEILDERSDPDEGTYRVILEPTNQYLSVSAPGFMTNRIHLTGLNARDVKYYNIEPATFMYDGDQTAERTFQDIKNTGIEFYNEGEYYFALDRFNDALRLRPNNARATRLKLQSEDEIAWYNAKIINTIEAYEIYLSGDTSKQYANEATQAIMQAHITIAEAYVKNNNIELAERYLYRYKENYPAGPDYQKAEDLLCKLYTKNGDEFAREESLNGQRSALNYYTQAENVCNVNIDLDQKINQTQLLYDRYSNPRISYTMFTHNRISTYGITFGSLNYFTRGGYLTLRLNEDLFTSRNDMKVDDSGNVSSTSTFSARTYEYTGSDRRGNAEFIIGFTYPVYYPGWIYAGLGYSYNPFFWEMNSIRSTDGEFIETQWIKNTDKSDRGIVFEFGAVARIIGLSIGIGLNGPNISELIPTFSIGFSASSSQ